MKIGENLQRLRKENKITQEALAEKCKVSRQAIAKWENNESIPTVDKLIYLADLYEVSLDELVGRSEDFQYGLFKKYLLKHAAKDIPKEENDDISAIIARYISFTRSVGLNDADSLNGLMKIFLTESDLRS